MKVLWWSGDGMNLYLKRLERGRFVWPSAETGHGASDVGAVIDVVGGDRLAPTGTNCSADDGSVKPLLANPLRSLNCGAMPAVMTDLPDDIETLKRLVLERDQVIAAKDVALASTQQERLLLVTTIEMLKLQIARLKPHAVRPQFREDRAGNRSARADRGGPRGHERATGFAR